MHQFIFCTFGLHQTFLFSMKNSFYLILVLCFCTLLGTINTLQAAKGAWKSSPSTQHVFDSSPPQKEQQRRTSIPAQNPFKNNPSSHLADPPSTADQPAYGENLKVLSWNIYMLPYFIFRRSRKIQRARQIANEINKMDYDIIVFQEAFKRRPRRVLKRKLADKFPYQYGPANKKFISLKTNSGLVVVSNRPLLEKGSVQYDACNSWDCFARKGAVMFEGEHQGHAFQIVGTHTNGNPKEINRHQFHMLYDGLLAPHYKEGVPQIIVGDMNCSYSKKEDYEAMLRLLKAEDTPLTGERRYSNWEQSSIIDYILLRRNGSSIQQVSKSITLLGPDWNPKGVKNRNLGGIGLSDHYPVEIEVKFE